MSLRNVTLTAVAALSFGMAAHAQTTTITVPLTEPGAAAPAGAPAGTWVGSSGGGTGPVAGAVGMGGALKPPPPAPRARRLRTGQVFSSSMIVWQRRHRTHSLGLMRPSGSIAPTGHFVSHSRHSRPHWGRRLSQSKIFSLAGIASPAPRGQT